MDQILEDLGTNCKIRESIVCNSVLVRGDRQFSITVCYRKNPYLDNPMPYPGGYPAFSRNLILDGYPVAYFCAYLEGLF